VAYIFSLENSEFPQESNFTKGNIKCLFLHGSKRGIQFLSGKSSAVFHIKENEGNWKSLPGASYEQRVQRFQWPDITSPFFFFFFHFANWGTTYCFPALHSNPVWFLAPQYLRQSPGFSLLSCPSELQPLSFLDSSSHQLSFEIKIISVLAKTYIHFCGF